MGLSVRTLLLRYFYLDEVKAALTDIGESTTGSKSQLAARLIATWESHNRDVYDVFEFLDVQTLRIICKDYGIDHIGDRITLLRRIRRSNLLATPKNSGVRIEVQSPTTEPPPSASGVPGVRRLRFRWPLWASILLTALLYFILPLFGLTGIVTQMAAAAICFIGVWSGLWYLSERA